MTLSSPRLPDSDGSVTPRMTWPGCSWNPAPPPWRRSDFPDDESMRISHEAIYQALYVQGRGALMRELVSCLRTGRALRVPRGRARSKPGAHVTAEVIIGKRSAEVEDRAAPGHWESQGRCEAGSWVILFGST